VSLLELTDVRKTFHSRGTDVPAVRGVSLQVRPGETLGLVGESGCGKSTLGKVIVGLQPPSGGSVVFDGVHLPEGFGDRATRRRVQMVFQHPYQSLNPMMRVEQMLAEPLRLLSSADRGGESDRIGRVLKMVGLDASYRRRLPREMSGGQQQRVAIARALICSPELIVLDEPTSGLDQSVRGRIVALLRSIQQDQGVSYLFISHDLQTVRRLADRVAVMYLGRIVELGETAQLFERPRHPYTRALLAAAPSLDPRQRGTRTLLKGETPNPSTLGAGCAFAGRCPRVLDRCRVEDPQLLDDPTHPATRYACFNPVAAAADAP